MHAESILSNSGGIITVKASKRIINILIVIYRLSCGRQKNKKNFKIFLAIADIKRIMQ